MSVKNETPQLRRADYDCKTEGKNLPFDVVAQVKSIAVNVLPLLGNGALIENVAAAFWAEVFPGAVGVASNGGSALAVFFGSGRASLDSYKLSKMSFDFKSDQKVTEVPADAKFPPNASPLPEAVRKVIESFLGALLNSQSLASGSLDPTPTKELVFVLNGDVQKVVSPDPTTIEGLGSTTKKSITPVQDAVVRYAATQCGYCTPGWVMAGHSYVLQKKCEKAKISFADIEDMADGNLCRCTGVRPLLTALKTFAEGPKEEKDDVPEATVPPGWKIPVQDDWSKLVPNHDAITNLPRANLRVMDPVANLPIYYQPTDLNQLMAAWDEIPEKAKWPIKFQFGNTGTGIYPDQVPYQVEGSVKWLDPKFRIDLTCVKELRNINDSSSSSTYDIGSCVTYTRFISFLKSKLKSQTNPPSPVEKQRLLALRYLAQRTAGYQLRNRSSLGGNTMMVVLHRQDQHNPPFPSDMCTALLSLNTSVTILLLATKTRSNMSLYDFIRTPPPVGTYLLLGYHIPKAASGAVSFTDTYKTALRHTMSHSYTNGGITMTITAKGKDIFLSNATMAFGGIGPTDLATTTAHMLDTPQKLDDQLVEKLLKSLNTELQSWSDRFEQWKTANHVEYAYSGEEPSYLISLGLSYLYKFLVTVAVANKIPVDSRIVSISWPDLIPLNKATVHYESTKKPDASKSAPPPPKEPASALAHKPVIKYEAYAQATGEVKYVREAPAPGHGVYFSWVYAKRIGTFKYKWSGPTAREAVKNEFAFKYGSAIVDYYDYEYLSQNPSVNIDLQFSAAAGNVMAETLLIKNRTSNCVGDRIGLIVANSESAVKKMAKELMDHGLEWVSSPDPSSIKLKLEDYQTHPSKHPDPDAWKSSRLIFPMGGVCVPDDATRDRDSSGRAIQNVVEREVTNPEDKNWKDVVVAAYNTPSKIAKLPFFITQRDGSTVRQMADCRVIRADHRTTEQAHFYLETNAVIAEPSNSGITLFASTQSPADCQSNAAALLKMSNNQIDVQVKQLGGGYGGKTVRSKFHAVAAALVCRLTGRPAKLIIEREDDSAITGRRHPYFFRVYLAILVDKAPEFAARDLKGTIAAFYMQAWLDTGFYYDAAETILNVAVEDSDGCYYSPLSRAEGQMLLTNKIANTAMRTFGHAAIMAIENAIEAAGHCTGIYANDGEGNSTSIRVRSIYTLNQKTPIGSHLTDNILPQLFYSMRDSKWYVEAVRDIREFNKTNRWRKRGHCLQPAKYKIGFEFGTLEQGHAIVNVFKGDGSVLVMHDGVEIGQGLSTKAIQIAATELGVPIELVQIGTTGAKVTPNPTSTGASSGSEIKGGATREACKILKKRLSDWTFAWYSKNADLVSKGQAPLDSKWQVLDFWNYPEGWAAIHPVSGQMIWKTVVSSAYNQRVDLSAEGFYTNPYFNANPSSPMPQVYGYVYASAYSEVEIDVITGNTTIREARLLVDAGKSMNPAVDVGQIEGAFLQGVGTVLTETVLFQPSGKHIGQMTADNTWVYKPPFAKDLPLNWTTSIFPSDDYPVPLNPHGLMSSKAMGEPPFILSSSVYCALKEAIYAARLENGKKDDWFLLPTPVTPQDVRKKCGVNISDFRLTPGARPLHAVPLATFKLMGKERTFAESGERREPLPISALASLDKNATVSGAKAVSLAHAIADVAAFRAVAAIAHK